MSKYKNYFNKIKKLPFKTAIRTILQDSYRMKEIFIVKQKNIKSLLNQERIYKKLKKKYSKYLSIQNNENNTSLVSDYNNKVWVCWLQGIENAPLLVQKCYKKMQNAFGKERVILITLDNYNKYVDIPEYIIKKWQKGIISHAHFSDVLRICLLVKYGGIWIDSTVYIMDENLPKYLTDENLFLFSNDNRNSIINISNWYICAQKNNIILTNFKKLLMEYWKKENYLIHYSVFHILFRITTDFFPDEWNKVPTFSNIPPHMLSREIFDKYSQKREKELISMCPIQKLNYKKNVPQNIEGTFYEKYFL